MNTQLVTLAILNEYLTLVEKELKSYTEILDELAEKITNEPSIYRKQVLENQRRLLAEEALMLHDKAMEQDTILKYISQRLG